MVRRALSLALAALAVAACATGEAAAPPSPQPHGTARELAAPTTEVAPEATEPEVTEPEGSSPLPTARRTTTTSTTESRPGVDAQATLSIGRLSNGNRLLMIGDSILASTSARYDGEMCDALVPRGWTVEIDAETGREIDFGNQVLDRRLDAGWDAAVVFLGNNYPSTPEHFDAELRRIVERLAPLPTVLVTVSEWDRRQAEVNFIVRSVAEEYGARVVDWAAQTAADDGLTRGDDLHPTDAGRFVLSSTIAGVLGRAPRDDTWRATCLPSEFVNDKY